jgi:site-specific DNA recombinase
MQVDTLPGSKCFIYLRRSQDREDRQQLSIDKQDTQVKQIIERNNLNADYLPPEERSAKIPGRPIFNDMMDQIEAGKARYIAVWALSRLSRNPIDGGRVIFALDSGKLLAIHTPTRTYRNTPDDKMVLAIELALAKKNNDDLSVQVRESFEAKRAHGQYPGPAPVGYVNAIIRPGERNIVPHEETGPKVVHLFEYASTGIRTPREVWIEAQNIGLTSRRGNILGTQTIIEILKRRAYTGVFQYGGGEWHQGTYEPLISVDLYTKVQAAMGWVRKTEVRPATTSGRFYPYKGLLLCSTCKFNVTAYAKIKKLAKGASAEYIFYTCTKKNRAIKCNEPQLSSLVLEQEIRTKLQEYEISEVDGLECAKWLEAHYEEYLAKKNQYRPVWLKEQREAMKAVEVLDAKLESGVISDDRYKARAAKHQASLARTKSLIESSDTDARQWLELARETLTGVTNIGDIFEVASAEERRQLMTYIGSNWYLTNKKVDVTPRRPIDLLHISNRKTVWRARPDLNRRSPP